MPPQVMRQLQYGWGFLKEIEKRGRRQALEEELAELLLKLGEEDEAKEAKAKGINDGVDKANEQKKEEEESSSESEDDELA